MLLSIFGVLVFSTNLRSRPGFAAAVFSFSAGIAANLAANVASICSASSGAELKALIPEDAKEAIGHGVRARRSKSGAISFDFQEAEVNHATL